MSFTDICLRNERKIRTSGPVSDKPTERESLGVNLSPDARAVIRGLREDTGVPNTEAMTRLLEWFAAMPRKFRLAILTKDAAGRDELLVDWLREHLAAEGLKTTPLAADDVTARVRLIHQLVNEIHATYEGTRDAAAGKRKKG